MRVGWAPAERRISTPTCGWRSTIARSSAKGSLPFEGCVRGLRSCLYHGPAPTTQMPRFRHGVVDGRDPMRTGCKRLACNELRSVRVWRGANGGDWNRLPNDRKPQCGGFFGVEAAESFEASKRVPLRFESHWTTSVRVDRERKTGDLWKVVPIARLAMVVPVEAVFPMIPALVSVFAVTNRPSTSDRLRYHRLNTAKGGP